MPVTPADVEKYTAGKVSASDGRVQPLIDAAYAAIERYCGWHVSPVRTDRIIMDGPGSNLLQLPTLRAEEVFEVSELDVVLSPDAYEWSANGSIRRMRNHWPSGWTSRFRAITVEYEHGFDSVPDLEQVVLQVVSQALSSPSGATREQAGALAVTWATTAPGVSGGLSLLERDLKTLDSYRLEKSL